MSFTDFMFFVDAAKAAKEKSDKEKQRLNAAKEENKNTKKSD